MVARVEPAGITNSPRADRAGPAQGDLLARPGGGEFAGRGYRRGRGRPIDFSVRQPSVPGSTLWNSSSQNYVVGDIVQFGADLSTCAVDHVSTEAWYPGAPGVSLWQRIPSTSSWATMVVYDVGDVVDYQGVQWDWVASNGGMPTWASSSQAPSSSH